MSELKPCPFCGGEAKLFTYRLGEDSEGAHVECRGCYAKSADTEDAYADVATASAAWNARTDDARIAALEAENKALLDALKPFAASLNDLAIKTEFAKILVKVADIETAPALLAKATP